MIIGNVNANREAIVQLVVLGSQQQQQEIQVVIDTGYTGFLTLPPAIITSLGLTWYARQDGILGDGSLCIFDVYEAVKPGLLRWMRHKQTRWLGWV
jgi:predicted aspartyl protease